MKKVAIDTGPLLSGHTVRGIGVHTKQLVEELVKLKSEELKLQLLDFSTGSLSGFDLIHYSSFSPYFLSLPLKKPAGKVVITIHDLIPLIYPEQYPAGIRGKIVFLIQRQLIKYVDAVITISETSKKDICRLLAISPDKVHVVYLAPKEIFKKDMGDEFTKEAVKKHKLPKQFVLYVGDVNYNKNLLSLADACSDLKVDLVIVGKNAANDNPSKHIENKVFLELLNKYKNNPLIHRVGYVPDEELSVFFRSASLYCHPAYYEGFGLGPLEAMSAGCPTLVSKINVHSEVFGNAVSYFDLNEKSDLKEKLRNLLKDEELRKNLSKLGLAKSKEYTWEKTAKETIKVYEKVL